MFLGERKEFSLFDRFYNVPDIEHWATIVTEGSGCSKW